MEEGKKFGGITGLYGPLSFIVFFNVFLWQIISAKSEIDDS